MISKKGFTSNCFSSGCDTGSIKAVGIVSYNGYMSKSKVTVIKKINCL